MSKNFLTDFFSKEELGVPGQIARSLQGRLFHGKIHVDETFFAGQVGAVQVVAEGGEVTSITLHLTTPILFSWRDLQNKHIVLRRVLLTAEGDPKFIFDDLGGLTTFGCYLSFT